MPGLIDAHIHTPPSSAIGNRELFSLLYLQHGVTTVRDLGQFDDDLPELIGRLNNGELAGPRMYHCGRILDGDPPKAPGAISVLSEEDGAAIVRQLANEGVDCIKVYDGLPGEAFKGISREAAAFGLPLIGHTPHAVKMSDIRNFESQHYTGIAYLHRDAPQGWAYKTEDLMNLTPDEVAEVIGVMSANNIAFLPTNANAMSRLTVSDAERFPASAGFRHLARVLGGRMAKNSHIPRDRGRNHYAVGRVTFCPLIYPATQRKRYRRIGRDGCDHALCDPRRSNAPTVTTFV